MLQKDNFGLILIDTPPQVTATTKFEHKNYSRQYPTIMKNISNNCCKTTEFLGNCKTLNYNQILPNLRHVYTQIEEKVNYSF